MGSVDQAAVSAEVPPAVEIAWVKERGTARVVAPAGWHVSDDAPGALALAWGDHAVRLEADGVRLVDGIALGDVRGGSFTGTLDVALCDLAGTTCRPSSWRLEGSVGDGKKGAAALTVSRPGEGRPFGPAATADQADRAFARAKESGKAVLLDFSAAWCPPCNALADEVLEGPHASELDGYEIAVLDVDNPSSFALKDRYQVRAYPTVVVASADGAEKTRFVGYTTRDAFLAWASGAASSTDAADFAKDPATVSPERAAELAWIQVQAGEPDLAKPWADRAATGADSYAVRRARFALAPTPADLEWLLANAADRAGEWASYAEDLKDQAPELVARAVEADLRVSRGLDVVNALQLAADVAKDPVAARQMNGAAAAILAGTMTGDPSHDKPYVEWLADVQESAGDVDGAGKTLRDAAAAWPKEPTFELALASMLNGEERFDEALAAADRALPLAWGDNRLRVVYAKAQALIGLGRADEARQLAKDELAAQPAPPEGMKVRTFRYRQRLEQVANPETAASK
jgi:thioredoxin-like negative regulator of GroEL